MIVLTNRLVTWGRTWRRRTPLCGRAALVVLAVAAIPYGSLADLARHIDDGTIVDTVSAKQFVAGISDDASRVTYQIALLKRRSPTTPAVYLVGGSAVRESISSDKDLAAAIAQAGARRPFVRLLASNMQTLPETLALIDNLPAGAGGVVVIGVHHITFISGPDNARLQLRGINLVMKSRALRAFVADRLESDPANDLRDGVRAYLAKYREKHAADAFEGPLLTYVQHHYGQKSVMSKGSKRRGIDNWLDGRGSPNGLFATNFEYSAALLGECVRLARHKGYEVLLMEDTLDSEVVGGAFKLYQEKYRAVCDKLVRRYDAHYVDLTRSSGINDKDFHDLYHLVPSGRAKWTPRLGASLATILNDHTPAFPEDSASPKPGTLPATPPVGTGLRGVFESAIATLS